MERGEKVPDESEVKKQLLEYRKALERADLQKEQEEGTGAEGSEDDDGEGASAADEALEDGMMEMGDDSDGAAAADGGEDEVRTVPQDDPSRGLSHIIANSDVILEVLDARDVISTRCYAVEQAIAQGFPEKVLILVLNKIDLVPHHLLMEVRRRIGREECVAACGD